MRETMQEIVAKNVPPVWLSQVHSRIQGSYAEALASVSNNPLLDEPERKHILPYYRRALVDGGMRRWALDCGLQATVRDTEKEGYQFTLIQTGQLCFTVSKTANSGALPDSCGFRRQHSRVNEMLMQEDMFPVPSVSDTAEDLIYAIITHGPSRGGTELEFVSIGFPNSNMTGWAEPPVSIFEIHERQVRLFKKPEADAHAELQEQQRTASLKAGVGSKDEKEDAG